MKRKAQPMTSEAGQQALDHYMQVLQQFEDLSVVTAHSLSGVSPNHTRLETIHRESNTDEPETLFRLDKKLEEFLRLGTDSSISFIEQTKQKSSQPSQTPQETQTKKILFHEVFKQERIRRGWTVEEMAEKIGVSPTTIAKWERGLTTPRDSIIIQSVLGKTPTELGLPERQTGSSSVSRRSQAVREASSELIAKPKRQVLSHVPSLEQAKPKSSQPPPMLRKTQATKILFHEVLKQERIRHGWRVGEMAEKIGVNANTIAKWEQGRKIPQDPTSIQSLCSLLGKTSAELGLESQY